MAEIFNFTIIGGAAPLVVPFTPEAAFLIIRNKSKNPIDLFLKYDALLYNDDSFQIEPDEIFKQKIKADEFKLSAKKNSKVEIISLSTEEFFTDFPNEIVVADHTPLDYNAIISNYRCRLSNTNGSTRFTFPINSCYIKGTTSRFEMIALSGTAGAEGPNKDVDLFSSYSKVGEDKDFHTESNTTSLYNYGSVLGEKFAIDISTVFSDIDPSDTCGLYIVHNNIGGAACYLEVQHVFLLSTVPL